MTCAHRATPSSIPWLNRLKKPRPARTAAEAGNSARRRLRAFYLHMALWTLQAWLAMFFTAAGYAKLTQSQEILAHLLGWSQGVDLPLVRAVGAIEMALAFGVLTPLVAWRGGGAVMAFSLIGIIGLTAFALALHLSRLEPGSATLNLVLAGLALAVLIGRLRQRRVSL